MATKTMVIVNIYDKTNPKIWYANCLYSFFVYSLENF